MTIAQDLMTSMDDQGAFFEVKEAPVFAEVPYMIGTREMKGFPKKVRFEDKKAIVRGDNTPISIRSKDYRLVTNLEIFEAFTTRLEDSPLDIEGASAKVKFANNGARTMVDFHFPKHILEVKKDDITELKITAKNGYDGLWAFVVRGGGRRLWCLNGCTTMDWYSTISQRHTKNLSVEYAANRVSDIMEEFDKMGEKWTAMLNTPVSDQVAWRAFMEFSGAEWSLGDSNKKAYRAYPFEEMSVRSPAFKLMNSYQKRDKVELGANAYAVYNTITYFTTHTNYVAGREATNSDNRDKKVIELMKGDYWTKNVCPTTSMN